jgi:hypothetical protein
LDKKFLKGNKLSTINSELVIAMAAASNLKEKKKTLMISANAILPSTEKLKMRKRKRDKE